MPEAEMPDAASVVLATKLINDFTGASYTCKEVAEMDPLLFEIVSALREGLQTE